MRVSRRSEHPKIVPPINDASQRFATKLEDTNQSGSTIESTSTARTRDENHRLSLIADAKNLVNVVVTLSPRANNKLNLKHENVEHIKLWPGNKANLAEVRDCLSVSYPFLQMYSTNSINELKNLVSNTIFLQREKESLEAKKKFLEQKLNQELTKNNILKNYNRVLKFNISATNTHALLLSVEMDSLNNEMQDIMWKSNNKFLSLIKTRKIIFVKKIEELE